MGLIERLFTLIFGDGRNVIAETAEIFRVNADAADRRAARARSAALDQLAAEFDRPRRGRFDRVIDGLNRIPRPAMAFGTLALFVAAMTDPVWFAERMQGIQLVPEPLWWLLAAIVSFYFGARHQAKGQEFQRSLAATMARTPQVMDNIAALRGMAPGAPGLAGTHRDAALELASTAPDDNPALNDWRATRGGRAATK
jgi:hypothetical protein